MKLLTTGSTIKFWVVVDGSRLATPELLDKGPCVGALDESVDAIPRLLDRKR